MIYYVRYLNESADNNTAAMIQKNTLSIILRNGISNQVDVQYIQF